MLTRRSRRAFLIDSGRGVIAVSVLAANAMASPGIVDAAEAQTSELTAAEAAALDALGDTLVPGAADAGIARYVDDQLRSVTPLLMLRYLDFPMPLADFYHGTLAALDAVARRNGGRTFAGLDASTRTSLVATMATGTLDGWDGPPAPLVYFAIRADAVDVCYGTQAGFARLRVPYAAHIAPSSDW